MYKQLIKTPLLITALTFSSGAFAVSSFDLTTLAGQQPLFDQLSEEIGATLSYKALAPAEPLGIIGFDLGIELSSTALGKDSAFSTVTGGTLNSVPTAKLHVRKGLPFGIDIGASYIPGSTSVMGYEISYAILSGGIAMPAIGIRLTSSKLSGSSSLGMKTQGYELSISKGFAMLTPYAGVGTVKVTTTDLTGSFTEASSSLSKTFYGANMNLGLFDIAYEGDSIGGISSHNLKFGFRF